MKRKYSQKHYASTRPLIYRTILKQINPERTLFLAIALDIYQDFFRQPVIQEIVIDHQIRLIVFEPETKEIVQWIS